MTLNFFILLIISPLIQLLPVDETLYNILKEKAPYEIVDYNTLFPNKEQNKENYTSNLKLNSTNKTKDSRTLGAFDTGLNIINSLLDLIDIAESIYSGEIAISLLESLTYKTITYIFKKIPKTYDFREKYKTYTLIFWQRQCEPASAYASALATSLPTTVTHSQASKSQVCQVILLRTSALATFSYAIVAVCSKLIASLIPNSTRNTPKLPSSSVNVLPTDSLPATSTVFRSATSRFSSTVPTLVLLSSSMMWKTWSSTMSTHPMEPRSGI